MSYSGNNLNTRQDIDKARWEEVLGALTNDTVPVKLLPHAIVRLGKVEDLVLLEQATMIIPKYLDHSDPLVRHEAMWFLAWSKSYGLAEKLTQSVLEDPTQENRSYAIACLGRMFSGRNDSALLSFLARLALDSSQPDELRIEAFEAVMSIRYGESARNYLPPLGSRSVSEIDKALLSDILAHHLS